MAGIEQLIHSALEHHGSGRLADAERIYREVLEAQPDHAEALHLLGVIALQSGDLQRAVDLIGEAVRVGPASPDMHNNLGEAWRGLGRAGDAEQSYRAALALEPAHQEALNNLGNALKDVGRPEEAEASYRRALKINPRYAEAHFNLANLLHDRGRLVEAESSFRKALEIVPGIAEMHNGLACVLSDSGRLQEAERSFRQALAINPDYAQAHANLGDVLKDLGRAEEAEQSCRRALELQPGLAEAHFNLGKVLHARERLEEAEASYRQALALQPEFAEAHYSLGNALRDKGRLEEAAECFRRAVTLRPNDSGAYNNLGDVLHKLGRLAEAEQSLRQALAINPRFAEARANLGGVLWAYGHLETAERCIRDALKIDPSNAEVQGYLGGILRDLGKRTEAERSLRRSLQLKPDFPAVHQWWGNLMADFGRVDEAERSFRRALALKPDFPTARSNMIFLLDMTEGHGIAELQEERRQWHLQSAQKYAGTIRSHENPRDPERKLRIGYVSGDFRQHSAYLVFAPVLFAHDRGGFEVFCYSGVVNEDDETARLKQTAQGWRSTIDLSDDALAEQIRRDRIDILVDLSGHSAANRLLTFARKPAPVQVTAWGYATGTGLPTIDYFLADPVLVPAEERQHYAEKVLDLPCCVCFSPFVTLPEVSPLPSLAGGPFTFGCLNRIEKISDKSIALWARILKALPQAQLLLKAVALEDPGIAERFKRRFRDAGVRSAQYVLLGKSSRPEHLRTFHRVDLSLDPYPHGGGVSTLEALWMGLPVVTLKGRTTTSRLSASILTAAGLREWIANSDDEYVRLAVEIAENLPRLAELRRGLRTRMETSIIGDTQRYTRAVETLYRSMWRRWCERSVRASG